MEAGGSEEAATFTSPYVPGAKERFWRKQNRLPAETYAGGVYSVTVRTLNGVPAFAEKKTALTTVAVLVETSQRHGTEILAYTFMPDHLPSCALP